MKGTILGFASKDEDCAGSRHLFSGDVCKCGRVRLPNQKVGPGATVIGKETK